MEYSEHCCSVHLWLVQQMGSKLFDFRCNGKENLFYVLGNYSLLGYVQIYNHLLPVYMVLSILY